MIVAGTQRDLDQLLFHWRAVIGAAPKGWERDFALSIQRARKRNTWEPSAKQLAIMRRMVSELFTETDDLDLVEAIERVPEPTPIERIGAIIKRAEEVFLPPDMARV